MSESNQERCQCLFSRNLNPLSAITLALVFAVCGFIPASAQSEAKMSQMLNQFESGKRPTYTTGGRSMGRASGMPGYANSMGGARPSNMGGYAGMAGRSSSYAGMGSRTNSYAGMGGNNNSQMMQMMRQRIAKMQQGGGAGGGSLMQLMQKRGNGTPNMMPGMGGGSGPGMGMQSGLFAKMMQQDASFNNNMRKQQMSHGMGMNMGRMKQPGAGMSGLAMPGMGMGMSRPGAMGSGGGMPSGILGRMGQQKAAPRVGSPFASKSTAPAKSGALSDLEKQTESQYGK